MRRGLEVRFCALAVALAGALLAERASAQDARQLAKARRLFADALIDEDAKRYDAALDKFLRVAEVKETPNVRYRVATCLEALGRRAEALAAYEETERLGSRDPSTADVVHAAAAKRAELDRVLPRLAVLLPPDAPLGAQVLVDASMTDVAALRGGVALDPGPHAIAAMALGRAPFRASVTLPESGRVAIRVMLEPIATADVEAAHPPCLTPVLPTPRRAPPTGAWIAFGTAAGLAAGSGAAFALWGSDRRTAPSSDATVQEALGIGLAAGAVVASGIGLGLTLSQRGNVTVAPLATPSTVGLLIGGNLPSGR